MNDVNIGQIIKELRLFRNMDEARFAERCKVDLSVVEGWENDTNIPTVMELHKIARVLQVSMDYFFREQERDIESSEECCNAIITAMYLMTEIQNVNVGRRTLLWRMIREELLGYILKKLDIPKFSIKNTTEKQRREIVGSFDELFGDEYDEVILGYIKGKNELNLLKSEYFELGQKYKTAEQTEREEKNETSTWKIYTQCVHYLDRAINAEFVDLRYAGVAVEKLKEYLSEKHDGINDVVLRLVYQELKVYCESGNEEGVRRILLFMEKYGEALWSQLLEQDRLSVSGEDGNFRE